MLPRSFRALTLALPVLALAALSVPEASAERFGKLVWPLCGDITEAGNTPSGWVFGDDCPAERAGDPAYQDGPISDTYGPRLDGNGVDFDWHRGIDLPVPNGTPVFAVAGGVVVTVEDLTIDKTVMIRHPHPGSNPWSCQPMGCWYSRYRHLSHIETGEIFEGALVPQGEYLGRTGKPATGSFYHLHFEIRATLDGEPDGSQREAIHPLAVLARGESGTGGVDGTMTVAFDTDPAAHGSAPAVDLNDPENPIVTVEVTLPDASQELDLDRVEMTVYRNLGDSLALVPQPNDYAGTSATPEGEAWRVDPASFGIQDFNRWFTYKNGYGVPYSGFFTGGAYESPWHLDLPPVWDRDHTPDFHLTHRKFDDTGVSGDEKLLSFNGVEVCAPTFNASPSFNQYRLYVTFLELDGVEDADELCLEAVAFDVAGNRSPVARWGSCDVVP